MLILANPFTSTDETKPNQRQMQTTYANTNLG